MNLCKSCGMLPKDCSCRRAKLEETAQISNCAICNSRHKRIYLKNYGNQEICSNCLTVAQIEPSDREYLRVLADSHNVPLYDIQTHIEAASRLNQTIDDYLISLPRSREQFKEYFKGKDIKVGNITL